MTTINENKLEVILLCVYVGSELPQPGKTFTARKSDDTNDTMEIAVKEIVDMHWFIPEDDDYLSFLKVTIRGEVI